MSEVPTLSDLSPRVRIPAPTPGDPSLTPVSTRKKRAPTVMTPLPPPSLVSADNPDHCRLHSLSCLMTRMTELRPPLMLRIYPSAIQVLLKEMCESGQKFLPGHNLWLLPHDLHQSFIHTLNERLHSRSFYERQFPKLCVLMGNCLPNLAWTAAVYIAIGIYDLLDDLTTTSFNGSGVDMEA